MQPSTALQFGRKFYSAAEWGGWSDLHTNANLALKPNTPFFYSQRHVCREFIIYKISCHCNELKGLKCWIYGLRRYNRQQNKCYPQRFQIVRKTTVNLLQHSVIKFDCSNKFDLCYYGQINSLLLKSSVASKWTSKHHWGITFILLAMVQYILLWFLCIVKDVTLKHIFSETSFNIRHFLGISTEFSSLFSIYLTINNYRKVSKELNSSEMINNIYFSLKNKTPLLQFPCRK